MYTSFLNLRMEAMPGCCAPYRIHKRNSLIEMERVFCRLHGRNIPQDGSPWNSTPRDFDLRSRLDSGDDGFRHLANAQIFLCPHVESAQGFGLEQHRP